MTNLLKLIIIRDANRRNILKLKRIKKRSLENIPEYSWQDLFIVIVAAGQFTNTMLLKSGTDKHSRRCVSAA